MHIALVTWVFSFWHTYIFDCLLMATSHKSFPGVSFVQTEKIRRVYSVSVDCTHEYYSFVIVFKCFIFVLEFTYCFFFFTEKWKWTSLARLLPRHQAMLRLSVVCLPPALTLLRVFIEDLWFCLLCSITFHYQSMFVRIVIINIALYIPLLPDWPHNYTGFTSKYLTQNRPVTQIALSHYFSLLFIIAVRGPVIMTTVVPVGSESTHMVCPCCRAEIDTSTRTEPGLLAWVSGGLLLLFGYICDI